MRGRSGKALSKKDEFRPSRPEYPFAAIVAQQDMKLALLLNLVDASVGGVLIMGHRGTGKSTIVRSVAALLPPLQRVDGCPFGCILEDVSSFCDLCREAFAAGRSLAAHATDPPVVTLPLGATEDRVCGAIHIEKTLATGKPAFEPGLIARAHHGFLYIDEVNLLDDHLVDVLLDVAASGVNLVEREGISVRHPARFVLIGSGNPEEGELRPQFVDRFGLHVEVETISDVDQRVEIVERRRSFELDPSGFAASYQNEQEEHRRSVVVARKILPRVTLDRDLLRKIVALCQELRVDGHRGELTISKAARAAAALDGRRAVSDADVQRVAAMCLRHRLRRDPLDTSGGGSRILETLERVLAPDNNRSSAGSPTTSQAPKESPRRGRTSTDAKSQEPSPASPGDRKAAQSPDINIPPTATEALALDLQSGRRRRSLTSSRTSRTSRAGQKSIGADRGRYSGDTSSVSAANRLAFDATMRAAVSRAPVVGRSGDPFRLNVAVEDLRFKILSRPRAQLYILVVDTSGSMALNRIGQVKGAIAHLLRRSYLQRDHVTVISLRENRSEIVLPPSRSAQRAKAALDSMPVGGATPLALGLSKTLDLIKQLRGGMLDPRIFLFTDGHANVPLHQAAVPGRSEREQIVAEELDLLGLLFEKAAVPVTVIDTQNQHLKTDSANRLAVRLRAEYSTLPALTKQQ